MNASVFHPRHTGWAARLDQVTQRVGAFRQPSETIFLAVGKGLHDAQSTARDLTILATALNRRLSEPEFRSTIDGLDAAVESVRRVSGRKDDRAALLAGMAETTACMKHTLGVLARTLGHIRALGLNARVEAAKMTTAGQDFTVFTHQIMRLASDGHAQVERAGTALAALDAAIEGARRRHASFTETHMRRLAAVGEHLKGSVALLKEREKQATEVLTSLPDRLEHVRSHVASIVANLQIGDMTRQRLEHVETALGEIGPVVRLGAAADAPRADGFVLGEEHLGVLVCAVTELQGQQIKQICGDFTDHVGSILIDIDALIGTLRSVTGDTQAVYADGADGGSTFLMEVDHDMARVLDIVTLFGTAHQEAQEVMAEVRAAAQAMRGAMAAVTEIDAEINVIGLNASIKCGNLGDHGRALNVIAQELRGYAGQTRAHAATIAGAITRLTDLSMEAAATRDGNDPADLDALKASLDASVRQLHQAGGETAWVLARIRDKGRAVAGILDASAVTLKEQIAAAADLLQSEDILADLHQEVGRLLPAEESPEIRRDVLAFLESHYTMASERELHAALLGTPVAAAPSAAAGSATTEEDLSDILF